MDTAGGACSAAAAAAAAHRVVDPAAVTTPMGPKRRSPDMTDGWTGTKKNKAPGEGGGSGEANSRAVVMSRNKRSYEYSELELDAAVAPEKMFKCNYWEDPAYAKTLQYLGPQLARSAANDNDVARLKRELDALWMAKATAPSGSASDCS